MSAIGVPFFALVCLFVFLGGQSAANVLYSIPSKYDTAKGLAFNLPFLRGKAAQPRQPVDVVFIIDDSGSIQSADFEDVLEGLGELLDVSVWDAAKFAAIKYSNNPTILFNFVSKDQAKRKLANVQKDDSNGMTNTQAALKMAREDLFLNSASSGHRSGAYRVAVLVTDGGSNVEENQTVRQATLLKDVGTKVFVIAIGNYGPPVRQEMKNIASSPYEDYFFRVKNYESFQDVASMVKERLQRG